MRIRLGFAERRGMVWRPIGCPRRANALVLLDDGMSYAAVARVLLLDDDPARAWRLLYEKDGIDGLASLGYEGSACRLDGEQQARLITWITAPLPRSTRAMGARIAAELGIDYQGRSGPVALLHRLGMERRKPGAISHQLAPEKQAAFIKAYDNRRNRLEADEAVLLGNTVSPTHTVRPVGCWAPKDVPGAVEQSSGRDRLNIHGAPDLETGRTVMKDVLTVDAASTILLLTAIEAMSPGKRLIHLFLDNARYHHAKLVREWLKPTGCRIKLHFIPAYYPHLNPIERLWGLMHRHIRHNTCHASFRDFSITMLNLSRCDVPKKWNAWRDAVTDNFRIIKPNKIPCSYLNRVTSS